MSRQAPQRRAAASFQLLLLPLLLALPSLRAQGEVLLSADTEGRLRARAERLGDPAGGGAARLATLLAGERARGPLLLLDAGNFLCGPDSAASKGAAAAAVLGALGYDAVNVSWRDFRFGKDATLAALQLAKLPAVSCNLVDARSGERLLPAFVTVDLGGSKLAVLGATEIPPGLEALPYLQAQLAGIRVLPALAALQQHLAAAKAAAPRVLVAFYGSADTATALQQALGADVAAIVLGGVPSGWLPDAAAPKAPLVAGAGADALRRLRFPDAATAPQLDVLTAGPELAEEPTVKALVQSLAAPASAAPPAPPPGQLAPGVTVPLDLAAENRGARLQVHSAALVARYGVRVPAAGMQLLVLDVSLQNIIPLTLVNENKVPTEYRIPQLGDHLYLVVGGRRIARLLFPVEEAEAAAAAGHLPVRDLKLARIGALLRGNVVFEVPPVAPGDSLELRFYDFAHGHLTLAIRGEAPAAAAPLSPLSHNEVVELGVYGVERRPELGGSAAPAGMTFVVVDVRARSTFRIDADATAFDPKAKFGQRLQVGTVADWTDSRRYLQLVADGAYGFPPASPDFADALPPAPRFLPDLMTGGLVAFLAPAAAAALQLRCDFPNAKSSLDGKLMRPKGFTVAIAGGPPALADLPALAGLKDSQFDVRLLAQQAVAEFGGEAAGDGTRFLLCDLEVRNVGKDGEFFQPEKQLQLATADGKLHALDPVAARGPRPALELLWVPPWELRRYRAVYRIPAGADRLRLCYASVDAGGARMMALPALTEAAPPPVAVAPTAEPAAPPAAPQELPPPAAAPTPVARPAPPAAPQEPTHRASPVLLEILKPPHPPAGIEGVGLTAEQVNRAIDRGAEFLWHFIRDNDIGKERRAFGSDEKHLLSALALVNAGAHKKHPDFDRELRAWLAAVDPRDYRMYQAGLLSMLIDAYGDPSFVEAQRLAVRSILETQGVQGTWNYSRPLKPELFKGPDDDQALRVTGGIPLEGEGPAPLMRTSDWSAGVDGDNSVSQYAMLGLDAAERSGTAIDREVWVRAEASFRERQCTDGGWDYSSRSARGYGSMACAGICSLAIALHQLGLDPRQDEAVLRGVAWLDANFAVNQHPMRNSPEEWLYYYLYSLERVGRILGLDFLGKHEWYPLGARFLLGQQKSDGSWLGAWSEADPRVASSFALLFLTRATPTLAKKQLARGGSGTLKTGVRLPPGGRYYFILDASGSMLEKMDGVSKWQIARDAVDHLVGELPETSQVALRVYGHRKNALEPDASDDTELVLPMRQLDKKQFDQKLQGLRARGKTPLAKSLLEAARDLAGATEASPVTLVLLTDGGEDSLPRQDPVAAAAVLGKLVQPPRSSVRLHVIGFDIGREEWIKQLLAMTAAGGGTYCPAQRAEQLDIGLRAAVLGVPESFVVRDAAGAERGRGSFGESLQLPEGRYVLSTTWAGRRTETALWINTDRTTGVTFDARPLQQEEPTVPPAAAVPTATPAPPSPPDAPAATPRFCTGCGKALTPGAKFCPGCGAKVKVD